jgi:hypothetical protein
MKRDVNAMTEREEDEEVNVVRSPICALIVFSELDSGEVKERKDLDVFLYTFWVPKFQLEFGMSAGRHEPTPRDVIWDLPSYTSYTTRT